MRTLRVVVISLVVAASGLAPAVEPDDPACVTACDATLESCQAKADADAEACREKAHEPCEVWCPCTQFIGAAYFACLLECEACEEDAERIAAGCPDGSDARATCAAEHRRCLRRCADGE